jgi:hypothetical protein
VRPEALISKERIIELRGAITRELHLHPALAKYIRRLVGATRPFNAESDWRQHSPASSWRSASIWAPRPAPRSPGAGW